MNQSETKKTLDMTSGSPLKIILLFTFPLILGNIMQQLYNIGDAKVVSYFLGKDAFGSVGATAVVSNTLISMLNGFTQGFGIFVANAFGAKDTSRIRRSIAGSAILAVLLTIVISIAAFTFIRPALILLNTPDEMLELSLNYVRIILIGIPFTALYNLTANLLRSLGNSKTPLYCLLASIVLNILLDLLFVGALHTDIRGAAAATVISQAVCSGSCFIYALIKYKEYLPKGNDWHLAGKEYKDLFIMGLSMGLMVCIVNIGTIILQGGINDLGGDIVAAHTAGRRFLEISMTFIYTYGVTMTTFVSQNTGAARYDRVRLGIRTAIGIVTVSSAVLIAFTFLFADQIVSWIASTDSEVICKNAAMYCKVGVCFYPALGPLFIFRCSLQGMGHKTIPIAASILELTVKILSVIFLVPALGYLGIALTEPISWVLMTLLLLVGYISAIKKL